MVALGRYLMGTRFEIVLAGDGDAARLRAAADEALDEVERIDGLLSLYRPDSVIAELNATAAEGWVHIPPDVFRLLQRALDLSRDTRGAFDITLLPLLRAWGFIGGSGCCANSADVETARALIGAKHVALDEATCSVRFDTPGVGLDLGAVGKGYALDQAAAILCDMGIESALLHGGTSTVVALGSPDAADAWRIAIRDPRGEDRVLESVPLTNGRALSVSAAHGKAFTAPDGRLMGHVLDPRTGEPAQAAQLAAVVADDATTADALSTALLVLGGTLAPETPAFRQHDGMPGGSHVLKHLTLERNA